MAQAQTYWVNMRPIIQYFSFKNLKNAVLPILSNQEVAVLIVSLKEDCAEHVFNNFYSISWHYEGQHCKQRKTHLSVQFHGVSSTSGIA